MDILTVGFGGSAQAPIPEMEEGAKVAAVSWETKVTGELSDPILPAHFF